VLEHDCPLFAEAGKLNRSIPGPAQSGPSRLSTGVAPGPVDSAIRQAATASFDTRPRLQRPSSISRGRNREAEQRYAQKIGSAITNTVSSNGDATSEQSRKLRDNAYEISTGSRSQVARLHPIIKKPPDVARSTDSANVGRDVDDMQVKKKVSKQKVIRRPADLRRTGYFSHRSGAESYSLGSIGQSSLEMKRIILSPP